MGYQPDCVMPNTCLTSLGLCFCRVVGSSQSKDCMRWCLGCVQWSSHMLLNLS